MIVVAACMAGYNFICAGVSVYDTETGLVFLNQSFSPIGSGYKYSVYEAQFMPYYLATYGLLLIYLTRVLITLRKCFARLKKGDIFYEEQAREFRRAGGGIIIFAKCRYLLMCAFGAICFKALQLFVTEIPVFLLFYFVGKLVLVLYHMAEKGAFLREENELTI
ncbi:hypothetical protein AM493_15500 [Flavobacterium akiainvivens]|uniref:DUF2975 domain-containing protein n=2 Tax=Flavobacterium akiainvivens TaxID=1202724 RepID=A0A0M9VJ27_9FLAO|nr:hypothetical protein AM493_15500 [Flavobacterium akiainvivens]